MITTLNVQHLTGLRDDAERITGVQQRELVPDEVVLAADRVDCVDTDPRIVLQRIRGRQLRGWPRLACWIPWSVQVVVVAELLCWCCLRAGR